ncbi:fumarylacetoacetate hydrolase family protein [Paracandidimonas soli]|uniref:2-keto-4-pentenoate hydratase/2-oxohepta-3-ene-1,7-dioic acid hydratase in catechol pathway n=1 Tax=Paracandidimonas soli TaxID=1917182 RepID=A0A4R3UR21_9BURK|nr:fumarylacetoacetate hydrolase family protein [Paracandidimonas soli]TCU93130.1 2-keto-4-pentenoate hydratase/2-oxohepta-3-ene-1,7-dioic acid hydratase in catechol pathway [Paracandidimonas soli]
MRFVTFAHQGRISAGILLDGDDPGPAMLIDGSHPSRPAPLQALAPTMMDWISHGLAPLSQAIRNAEISPACLLRQQDVRLLAPLPDAGKIVGAAFNYRDGLAASGRAAPEAPVTFVRSRTTIIGPDEPITIHEGHEITYEAELAAVIGRPALNCSREQAMPHVCGYTLFNDVSYADMVRRDGNFVRGKNQPASGPLGPWIVSSDDVDDPHGLAISLSVDGRQLQSSSTNEMLFRIDELIAFISTRMPLDTGDIIATGTPAGVASNHSPPAWLQPGQTVILSIPGFGKLGNPVTRIGA